MSALPEEDPVPPPAPPAGKSDRPDWLVGAEEGLQAEIESAPPPAGAPVLGRPTETPETPGETPAPPPRPVLRRPGGEFAPPPAPVRRLPGLDDARHQVAGWVPRLEITTELKPSAAPAEREDAGFAARLSDADEASDPFRVDPREARAPRRHDFPDADRSPLPVLDPEPVIESRPGLQAVAVEAAKRSWKWVAGAAVTVLLGATLAHAIGFGTTPIRQVLHNPARYDGRTVRVRGQVSQDVYNVGGSYTFYLLQGRDSLVVFTRFRIPHPKEGVEISAQVSTGTLDNALRPALLEMEPAQGKK